MLNATYEILNQHPEVIAELSRRLRLPYMEMKDNDSNVCFVNSEEVRPEFRQVFRSPDVAYYLIGLLKTSIATALSKEIFHLQFPYPNNADDFWSEVEKGRIDH